MTTDCLIDPLAVRRNFRRVARSYGDADFLAREVDSRMQERLDYIRIAPRSILDIGAGPCLSFQGLSTRYPEAAYLGVDLEPSLFPKRLQTDENLTDPTAKRAYFLASDAECLPFLPDTAELVWSNLLLPWLPNPANFFQEALRCLKPGGLLMFSALGVDTLKELRESFQDHGTHTPHIHPFISLREMGDMLFASGFSDPVADREILTLTYPSLEGLLKDLRDTGSVCALKNRKKGLSGKGMRKKLESRYETYRQEGRLPVTVEILYGHAWKPETPEPVRKDVSVIQFKKRPIA